MTCVRQTLLLALVALVIGVTMPITSAQEAQNQNENNSKEGGPTRSIWPPWPVVNVEKVNNNSVTGVHVPIFFDMTNESGRENQKLDLSVMGGLVSVNQDKKKQNGTVSGPLTVSVFGIPVYAGRTQKSVPVDPLKALERSMKESKELLIHPVGNSALEDTGSAAREFYTKIRKTNENILRSFSEMLSRTAKSIENSIPFLSDKSGRPVNNEIEKFVKPSRFNRDDFLPRNSTPNLVRSTASVTQPDSSGNATQVESK